LPHDKKHIVLLTTWFSPLHGVAVSRMHAIVKYLDHDKFRVSVITLKSTKEAGARESLFGAEVYRLKNDALFSKMRERAGESKAVHYLKVLWNVALSRVQHLEYGSWKKQAEVLLEELHSENKIHAVISSYAPAEAHLAALHFCIRHPDVKWIADMRDEMSCNPHLPLRVRTQLARLEQQMDGRADAITTVSQPILDDFKRLIPHAKYFEEIRNGFDHEMKFPPHFNTEFTIAYGGTFYGENKPGLFFEALQQFQSKTSQEVRLWFIGTNRNFHIPTEFRNGSTFFPVMPNAEAVKQMAQADATLLTLPPVQRKGVYSGKLFDYISVMKPVIAIVDPEDVAARLIRELGAGFVAGFQDVEAMERAISGAFELWKEKKPLPVDPHRVDGLHRKHQVKKLEMLLDKLLA